ncbi:TPA: helix-turn-helix domain-containing protein [Salmonella enterica subsp. enterica serovar Bovismorbificans]
MNQLIASRKKHMESAMSKVGSAIPAASNTVRWVQTERATHEAWGQLTIKSPRAAALAHFLVANMESSGAVVASYATLAKMTGMSVSTIRRAIDDLKGGRWLEVVQIGGKGGANAFRVNSRVGWTQSRDKLHLAAFTARVIVDKSEQTSLDEAPLRRIPTLMPGEAQLSSGPGEDPPSQPSFEGMKQDLPVVLQADQFDPETGEIY